MNDVPGGPTPYQQTTEQVFKKFDTSVQGLDAVIAKTRLDQYGLNHLEQTNKQSWLVRYLRQFKDLMIVLLLASSVISWGFLGDQRTGVVLLALVLFNTIIGFTQEYKAERIMESLTKLVVSEAKVVRGGKLEIIASTEIVPGDVVYIEEGDSVPCDMRIFDESELATNDFALTGESNPSRKFTHTINGEVPIGDRHNLTYMGTTVATGHGHGVVIATGMHTELGRIANLSQDTGPDLSPLQKEMNNIASKVTLGTVLLCAVLLPIAIKANMTLRDAFLFAIGIASSIIPQGLPAEINTTLAQAANKLARARALVKKLSAVESLGATSIICTDKTGTLTKNQMTVEQIRIGSQTYGVTGIGYEANGHIVKPDKSMLTSQELSDLQLFFSTGVFASNARVDAPDAEHNDWYAIGDPTEAALITLARKAGLEPLDLENTYPEQKEFSFDSARKRMSSVRAWGDGKQLYVFVKGAPESVLEKCSDIWDHGHTRKLSKKMLGEILAHNEQLARGALRNLSFAFKVLPASTKLDSLTMESVEQGLTYLGMVSMVDPLREEVPEAMQAAHNAHIRVSIITGDYASTAQAIALKAGLAKNKDDIKLVVGEEVQKLSDQQILDITKQHSVLFSRVSPEDKLRIVGLIKDSGRVVAVTGDGINDAPALKRADIGVAMGVTGTDVAKQSSDIILLDDSFHTLVGAVQQGRIVFQNIKKGTLSCFTSNAAELVVNLVSLAAFSLFHVPLALTVMQILAIDLVAELFPIAALGWDQADRELMQEPARDPKHHILNRGSILDLAWCGLLIGSLAFANYLYFFHRHGFVAEFIKSGSTLHMRATALTYLTIVLCQLGNILQRRSQEGLSTRYQLHNSHLWGAMLLSLGCVLTVIYSPINTYFGAAPLMIVDWVFALGAAGVFIAIRELQRYLRIKKPAAFATGSL